MIKNYKNLLCLFLDPMSKIPLTFAGKPWTLFSRSYIPFQRTVAPNDNQ